ncbi:MAG: T9SS type A sorting domain-containing protein, partial [Bacteroidota bacterium]|nr:T9SS type A sorting domain-containing protein [Bacteroidota bacterium]
FDNGSSISHLDEATFNAPQDANRLMTPHIASAESIHDPGTVLLASLADMGWVYTNIDHEPLKDTERKNGLPYTVKVRVHSDRGYQDGTVKLHYTNNGTSFTVVAMTATEVAGEYEFPLPGTTIDLSYGYFISVTDDLQREFTSPGKIQEVGKPEEQGVHFFHVGDDKDPPEITHEPIPFTPETNDELALSAEVTDNLGVREVVVEYKVSDGPLRTAVMQRTGTTDEFTGVLDLPGLTLEDEIRYRIIASDLSASQNVGISPADDFYTVEVTGMMQVQDAYSNDFNHLSNDFFGASFSIITPAGFRNGAIHSNHPYENGTGPNDESNYTYQLQIPIRIDDAEPVIKFDELVLVEPGEEGSEFGGDDFYDYAVVEGSADGGLTWKAFEPGYDSRANSVWLTRYNSNLSGDNSQAIGDSTLFRQRVIDMLESGDFSTGDVVLIRFRLFADQFAHGWGWAIDNLSIQTPVTGIERPGNNDLRVYPVPARTQMIIELTNIAAGPVSIQITDALGRTVYTGMIDETTGPSFSKTIDLAAFYNGFYFLRATAGKATYTRKFLKMD